MTTVEREAIAIAEAYARANGAPLRVGVGLVLAGMTIAAACGPAARAEIVRRYHEDFPGEAEKLNGWAARLDEAAQ